MNQADIISFFKEIWDNLTPYNIVSTLIGVTGIIVSAISLFIARQSKRPKYMVRNTNIIGETTLDTQLLDIHYNNVALPVLSVSKVAFWNSGRLTLHSSDISSNDIMRIEVLGDDVAILDYKILYHNDANNLTLDLTNNKKCININFEYFAHRQGFVVKIFHTGKLAQNMIVKGSIKDGKSAKRIDTLFGYSEETPTIKQISERSHDNESGKVTKLLSIHSFKTISGLAYIMAGCIIIGGKMFHVSMNLDLPSFLDSMPMYVLGVICLFLGYLFIRRPLPSKLAKVFDEE